MTISLTHLSDTQDMEMAKGHFQNFLQVGLVRFGSPGCFTEMCGTGLYMYKFIFAYIAIFLKYFGSRVCLFDVWRSCQRFSSSLGGHQQYGFHASDGSLASKRKVQIVAPSKSGLASTAMPGTRTGSKPGGNSQDPIKPLPRRELSPHLAVITSTDVHILRAIATSLIKLLYTPNLMEVLSRSARLTGLDKAETDDLLDTMVLRLGVRVYSSHGSSVSWHIQWVLEEIFHPH